MLVVQSFGKENEYRRAVLTVLSFFAHTPLSISDSKVILYTDRPDWFTHFFNGLPVQYILLTPEKIKEMRGEIDFLHRMKIAIIEEAFSIGDGPLLYADSDTFFISDPTPLTNQLSPKLCFMHLHEYHFEEIKDMALPAGQSFRDFYNLIISTDFTDTKNNIIKVTPAMSSWNAGVMFFHPAHSRFIPDVYALTDQFYPPSKNHASEQFAFSVILQKQIKISPCDGVNYHYWYRIKKQIADQFLERNLTSNFSLLELNEKLRTVKKWTKELPGLFISHEWMIQDHSIQAFNSNEFGKGYKWALKAIFKKPYSNGPFIKDVLYHTKRLLTRNAK